MNAIRLIQTRDSRHAIEKKRIQRYAVFFCQTGKQVTERIDIFFSEIGACIYPRQHDPDAARLQFDDNLIEIPPGDPRIHRPQHVVGAQFNQYMGRFVRQRPVQPRQPAGRRIAEVYPL